MDHKTQKWNQHQIQKAISENFDKLLESQKRLGCVGIDSDSDDSTIITIYYMSASGKEPEIFTFGLMSSDSIEMEKMVTECLKEHKITTRPYRVIGADNDFLSLVKNFNFSI